MSRFLTMSLLLSLPAVARPWNGIAPGAATSADVTAKFGEPSKVTQIKGSDVLVYSNDRAIKGARQAQFRIDATRRTVTRIDVYPAVDIDAKAIEKSYGPECAKGQREACYVRRENAAKHLYFTYPSLGLAIFFNDDNATVKSLTFLPDNLPDKPE